MFVVIDDLFQVRILKKKKMMEVEDQEFNQDKELLHFAQESNPNIKAS
jgi:hypothetical protein